MHCTACSTNNPAEASFCLRCGAELGAGDVRSTDPQRATLERALGAQYEIGRLLGRGGMGAVYHARETALDRPVAIKVLPPDLAGDADSRERFRREARTAARLTHPNIVPLYTFGQAEGMLFFVMGYVRGESLGERMKREGRLQADDVRRIIGALADALDYAHRQGVIHRDIKPDNVLLDDETGRPMLTDFGVAKAFATGATLTEAGAIVGTPHYMSPEQAGGARDLDGRSDLYSLGVMGYAMLCGHLPFVGESFQSVVLQHITREPAPLSALVPESPADLSGAITRCLEKDPARRWSDGRSLAQALGEADDDGIDQETTLSITGTGTMVGVFWTISAIFALLGRTTEALSGKPPWWILPTVFAGIPTIATGLIALYERRRGDPWKTIIGRIMRPLRRWPFWWPARWRRSGDVWHRLPAPFRRARWMYAMMVPAFAIELVAFAVVWDRWYHEHIPSGWITGIAMGAFAVGFGGMVGGSIYATRWAMRHGLGRHEASRAIMHPTADRAFWRRAKHAALLLPANASIESRRVEEPRSPDEYARAIAVGAAQLTGPLGEACRPAVAASNRVVEALALLDRELAVLNRDVSPAEIASLEKRIAALGDAKDDAASRVELRQMLSGQLALLRRLCSQMEDATQRRAKLTDLLRTLWLQVATLRADAARDEMSDADLSGSIRAVVEEIGAYVSASDTIRNDMVSGA